MNRLANEKSPYLLQHSHNPVDWFAWGPEAFDTARREDKPIFLSVGYSTCHWCHVMERESFENDQIAGVLNQYFVPVKVDREERPDVDRIYMSFVQASTGSGGWPMSVFLTPDLKPFFGGTYFPPDSRYGRPGFIAVLQSLARAWQNERGKIDQSATDVIAQLKHYVEPQKSRAATLDYSILDRAFQHFRRTFDSVHGGFGGAPKFPRPAVLNFLVRYWHRSRNEDALEMTVKTLRRMAEGGMNDQLGGGFHRYSVDERWFVPHFEKMLYDQAQLAISYVEAFQITKDPFYRTIARNTLDYVLRDMTDPRGGFYSAEDADSVIDPAHPHEKGEGAFYVWSQQEIEQLLGQPGAAQFAERFGVQPEGNVEQDPQQEFTGKNILYIARPATYPTLEQSIGKLFEARGKRIRPHLDDKILTAWNGLMISAFAKSAQVLEDPRYATAARRAADFNLANMYDRATGVLLRRYREGDAAIPGFLDDYAFFAQGLIDLYETDFRIDDLEMAATITRKMIELFEDRENGGFFSTAEGDASLVIRMKDDYDGAEPAGNSIALLNLCRLARVTSDPEFDQAAERTLNGMGARISHQPVMAPQMLAALDVYNSPKRQVILAADPSSENTREFLREFRAHFSPATTILMIDSEHTRARLARMLPSVTEMKQIEGQTTAYVCENFSCQLPATSLSRFVELLQ